MMQPTSRFIIEDGAYPWVVDRVTGCPILCSPALNSPTGNINRELMVKICDFLNSLPEPEVQSQYSIPERPIQWQEKDGFCTRSYV